MDELFIHNINDFVYANERLDFILKSVGCTYDNVDFLAIELHTNDLEYNAEYIQEREEIKITDIILNCKVNGIGKAGNKRKALTDEFAVRVTELITIPFDSIILVPHSKNELQQFSKEQHIPISQLFELEYLDHGQLDSLVRDHLYKNQLKMSERIRYFKKSAKRELIEAKTLNNEVSFILILDGESKHACKVLSDIKEKAEISLRNKKKSLGMTHDNYLDYINFEATREGNQKERYLRINNRFEKFGYYDFLVYSGLKELPNPYHRKLLFYVNNKNILLFGSTFTIIYNGRDGSYIEVFNIYKHSLSECLDKAKEFHLPKCLIDVIPYLNLNKKPINIH